MKPNHITELGGWQNQPGLSRRKLLATLGTGMGMVGLAGILARDGQGAIASPLSPKRPHFAPRAKRIIHLLMNGGPSHLDTFDPKPILGRYEGQRPKEVDFATQRRTLGLLKSPFKFRRHGQAGLWVSEIFPHVASCADDLCVIRGMHTDIPEHVSGLLMLNIGVNQPNRPSMGSWLAYGLGTENENLPGFVVLSHRGDPRPGPASWSSSFLPGIFSGTFVDTYKLDPKRVIPDIGNGRLSRQEQRRQLNLLQKMNRLDRQRSPGDAALEARIQSLELAFRMQFAAPEAFDISRETQSTLDLYGIKDEPTYGVAGFRKYGGFAEGALIARRLSERGVRVVQLAMAPDIPWDDHTNILDHRPKAFECDRAIAALIKDLKQRGLLDETLILWGGEFGRTPTTDPTSKLPGRDHNHFGFCVWLAGGGVKGGITYGGTDTFGMKAAENRMHVHDLHATILHLMGLDHEQLTYRYSGRDFRLTDVEGDVAKAIMK